MVDLAQLEANRRFTLRQALRLLARKPTAELWFDVVVHHRVVALCRLLAGDRRGFASGLARSGLARAAFLRSPQVRRADSRLRCISHDLGLEVALAAGDRKTALTIVRLSGREHLPDCEYEDDFLFACGLHDLVLLDAGEPADPPAVLARLQKVAGRTTRHLPGLLRALIDRDARGFHQALAKAIERRVARFEELGRSPHFPKDLHAVEGKVWIQGLAIVRLAELRGLRVPRRLRMMPPQARLPLARPLPPAAWKKVD